MTPPKSSEPGRSPLLSSTIIPDLTDRIVRTDGDQYCAAGGFGDVFRCRYTSDDGVKEVAVKAFRFGFKVDEYQQGGEKAARMIRRELGIWRRLKHRNVVPFLGIVYGFGRQGNASLVSVWMPHGTLHTFLEVYDDQLAVAHRLRLLLDIANGLRYLHSFPLIHGDLSSNNVLLDHDYNACLTDFGCTSLVGEFPEGFTYLKMSTVGPGTIRWAAPEHFSLNEEEMTRTIKSDIYSFGNMTLLVLSGKYPWSEVRSDPAVMLRLSQGLKPGRPLVRPIDDRHWALIERCWASIPERPPAEDVVSSLEQLLTTYPPPPPLCDLLDVPAPSSPGVPNRPGSGNWDGNIAPTESPLKGASALSPQALVGDAQLLASRNQTTTNELGEDTLILHPLPEDIRHHIEEPSHERPLETATLGTNSNNILVAQHLPTYLNEASAQALFERFGKLKNFHLVREDGNGLSKGVAFFEYVDESLTDVAVQILNGMRVGDRYIVVQREEASSSGADETRRSPLAERKAMGGSGGKKPTHADKDDSKKRPECAGVVHSHSNPTGPDSKMPPERASYSTPLGPYSTKERESGGEGYLYSGQADARYSYIGPGGYYYSDSSGSSMWLKDGLRAEDTAPQKTTTARKRATDLPSDGPAPPSRWVRGMLLGKGTYGRVYLALDTSTGEMIAVKQVEKGNKDAQHRNFVAELAMERKVLSALDHPHIVAYLGSEETTATLSIFLEFVTGGTIASCLREHGRFNDEVIKSFTAQLFDGLAYLHANHIIHRNIETNSILVDPTGVCKISGLGNAKRVDDDRASWIPLRGTVDWTAPEIIGNQRGKRYGPKVDIWSAGFVLVEMWMGGRAVEATRRGGSPPFALDVILSDLAVDFRNRCFTTDPEMRASATELIQHPYLTLAPDWVFTGFK